MKTKSLLVNPSAHAVRKKVVARFNKRPSKFEIVSFIKENSPEVLGFNVLACISHKSVRFLS